MKKNDTDSSGTLKETGLKKILSFLNTPLGLWLLSSIFIGLISYFYQSWNHASIAAREKEERIFELKIEINRRIVILNKEIEWLTKFDTMNDLEKEKYKLSKKLEKAIRMVNSKNCYVFEQFRKRKLSSLLFELSNLLPEGKKSLVQDAFEDVFIIEQFPSNINKKTPIDKVDKYFQKILICTKTSVSKEKWKNN
jgi:hypothetical protein